MCLQAYCELNPSNQAKSGESIVASSRQDVPTDARPYFKQIPSSFAKNPIENGTLTEGHISNGCLCKRRLAKNIEIMLFTFQQSEKMCVDWRNSSLYSQTKWTEYGDKGTPAFYTNCPSAEKFLPPLRSTWFCHKKSKPKNPRRKVQNQIRFFLCSETHHPRRRRNFGFRLHIP